VAIVERAPEIGVLRDAVRGAAGGSGSVVALVGEPGAGKSALVEAAVAEAGQLRVLQTRCDPLDTPRPLGPFRDLPGTFGELGGPGSSLADDCATAFQVLLSRPTLLVVEDLHWVDAGTVEVLRYLVRRIGAMPLALVLTYRDDDIGPRHSARMLLGDLATEDDVRTLRLRPLSVDAVAELLTGTTLDPVRVHALTGGNPFFVAAVAREPDRPLPASVRDAVLARTAHVSGPDLEVLQLAAVAPDRIDDTLLPPLGVDLPTLQRLHETRLLVRDGRGLVFEHELARLAVESTIPAGGLTHMHGRLLRALEEQGRRDPALLTHHAVAAGDRKRAADYARLAADESARAAAHTEAVAFYGIALQHLDHDDPRERAALLARLAIEQFMTNQIDEGIATTMETASIYEALDDPLGQSAAHEACAIFHYYGGRRREAELHARRACALAEADHGPTYGVALLARGYIGFQAQDVDLSDRCAAEAREIAAAHGDGDLGHRSLLAGLKGGALVDAGGARGELLDAIAEARLAGVDDAVGTAYTNLVDALLEQRRLDTGGQLLDEALAFSTLRDIPICEHWETGLRSRLRLMEGRWEAALEDAAEAMERVGMPLATFWPQVATALVHLRRDGRTDDIVGAWALAESVDESLKRLAVLSARAERWWLTGTPDELVRERAAVELERAAQLPATQWSLGELALWLHRLGLPAGVGAEAVATPYRLSLDGQHEAAADEWRRIGAVYEEAMALGDATDPVLRARAVERLDGLGAHAVADRLRRRLRQEGAAQVPQRPQASTRANPAGLTNRQLDVARLVSRGLTNGEIAERLFISPKTTEVHVSAVLAKLAVASRREVMLRAAEFGLAQTEG
jgi:DNA-binding CsgD family transcriptional regulator/tetratricopeptide (TPR) repeat protein